jgi:hypothetical protein
MHFCSLWSHLVLIGWCDKAHHSVPKAVNLIWLRNKLLCLSFPYLVYQQNNTCASTFPYKKMQQNRQCMYCKVIFFLVRVISLPLLISCQPEVILLEDSIFVSILYTGQQNRVLRSSCKIFDIFARIWSKLDFLYRFSWIHPCHSLRKYIQL